VLDDGIDSAAELLIACADGNDVVGVMGNAGGKRPAPQSESADERHRWRCIGVVVDHRELEDVLFGVGEHLAVVGADGKEQLARQELSVVGFDDPSPCPLRWEPELLHALGAGTELVGALYAAMLQQGLALVGYELSVDVRAQDAEVAQVLDDDEISRIAHPEQAHGEPVVLHRMQRSRPQHIEEVVSQRHCAANQLVDMPLHQEVGMLVIRAEHAGLRMQPQQRMQGIEVARSPSPRG
jgi:hypothetical protein